MNHALATLGRKAFALLLTTFLVLGITPLSAHAAPTYTIDVSTGTTEINQSSTIPGTLAIIVGGTVSHDGIDPDSNIVLTGTTTTNPVIVDIGDPAIPVHLEFDSLNIKGIATGPFAIKDGSTVDITLTGASELRGGDTVYENKAMLSIGDDATLTFTAASTGSLLVNTTGRGAGIGTASFSHSTGSLVVNGGSLEVKVAVNGIAGGSEAAMLGGGEGGSFGSVTMNGGTVQATAAKRAAIGARATTINGGTVIAANNPAVSYYSEPVIGTPNGITTITGGTITATGSGSNIGGNKITITGGSLNAAQGTFQTQPSNGCVNVYPTTLSAGSAHTALNAGDLDTLYQGLHTGITADPYVNLYRISGIVSDAAGDVYPWLPAVNVPIIDVDDHTSVTSYDDSGLPRTIAAGLTVPAQLVVLNKDDFGAGASFEWSLDGASVGTASSLMASAKGAYTLAVTDTSRTDGTQAAASSLRTINLQAQYPVAFDKNGGFGYDHTQNKLVGTSLPLDPNGYTRTGYSFDGWNTMQNGQGTPYADGAILATDHTLAAGTTVTLYAQWTPNTYYAQFVGNAADTGTMPKQSLTYGDATQILDENQFSRTGYTFAAWNTEYDGSGTVYTDEGAVTPDLTSVKDASVSLFAQWTANSYTVIYDGNGSDSGYPMANQTFTYDDSIQALDLNSFGRTGYTFTGWNTDPDDMGGSFADGAVKPNVSAIDGDSATLYAQWVANTYDIAFNGNGSDAGTMNPIETVWDAAVAVSAPDSAYSLLGYTFTGWNTQADGGGADYAVNSDLRNIVPGDSGATVVLYAQWAPTQYDVIFDGNDSDSGVMPRQLMTYDNADALDLADFGRTGYLFSSWLYTAPDGSQHNFADGETVTNLSSDGTAAHLTAQWTPINYTVHFQGNQATSGSMFDLSLAYDQVSDLPLNTFGRGGHSFAGWNDAPDGSGTTFSDAETIANLSATDGDVITLHAQWKEHTPTIALDAAQGYVRGAKANISGSGFEPDTLVTLTMYSTPIVVGSLTTDAQGNVAGSFIVPSDASFGSHTLEADDGFHRALTQFEVVNNSTSPQTADSKSTSHGLAGTGDTAMPVILGAVGVTVLAAIGLMFVYILRKRQQS